jgi:hypothetical protein
MLITRILILSLVVITINLAQSFFLKTLRYLAETTEKTQNNFVGVDNGTTNLIDYDSDGDLDAIYTGTSPVGDVFEI